MDQKQLGGSVKPRIWRWHGIWHCAVAQTGAEILCGLGYSPVQAWIDWKILSNKYPETPVLPTVEA